jgi:hypothetical protein
MPAKGTTRVSQRQRKQIAAAKLSGKTYARIGAETGLSPRTIERAAHDPRTLTLIQRLTRGDEKRLTQAWNLAVGSLLICLRSKYPDVVTDARRDLLKFVTAGDPPLAAVRIEDASAGDFTLEELLVCYRRVTVHDAGDSSAVRG